jgi:hypothetical protein
MNEKPENFPKDEFLREEFKPNPPRPGDYGDGPPEIVIRVGEMQRAVDEAEKALIAAQASWPVERKVFLRGDRIVSLAIHEAPDHKGRRVETQVIVEISEHGLAERLAAAATFHKYQGRIKGLKQIDPPKPLVLTMIGRGYNLKLPVLVGVVNCPQLAADGRILDKPGYDAQTGVFYDPRGAKFPAIPENPTLADAMAAKTRLLTLFKTFDFQSETDRAVAVSLIFTRLARIGMATAPLHAFDAPGPAPAVRCWSTSPASSPPASKLPCSRRDRRRRSSRKGCQCN